MKFVLKILKIIFVSFLVLLLLSGIISLLARAGGAGKLPVLGGYRPVNVLGASMEPAIKMGSVIIIKKIEVKEIKVGDVITYKPPKVIGKKQDPTLTTHRVVKIIKKSGILNFKTKGDANKTADISLVSEGQLVGKVALAIPYMGKIGFFARTPLGLWLIVILPGVLIIVLEMISIITHARGIKNAKKA